MSLWEGPGQSDDWYTPKYVFDALGCTFDLDVAAPQRGGHVPCRNRFWCGALSKDWRGHFVWMNPPFGGRNGLVPWLNKFFAHGDGIALVPDRTSAPWWQAAARQADSTLFVAGKIKFERPDGSVGKQPSTGTCLLSVGYRGNVALRRAEKRKLGIVMERAQV